MAIGMTVRSADNDSLEPGQRVAVFESPLI
jgi:hypothetical protein